MPEKKTNVPKNLRDIWDLFTPQEKAIAMIGLTIIVFPTIFKWVKIGLV